MSREIFRTESQALVTVGASCHCVTDMSWAALGGEGERHQERPHATGRALSVSDQDQPGEPPPGGG